MTITSTVGNYNSRIVRVPVMPAGVPFAWFNSTFPASTLECNGQTFDVNAFPDLALAHPSGQLPDLRGVVLRGMDRGSGRDTDGAGRKAGDYQTDQYGSHSHKTDNTDSGNWHVTLAGADAPFDFHSSYSSTSDGGYVSGSKTGLSGGTETRMKNVTCYWLVYTTNMPYDTQMTGSNAMYLGGVPASSYALTSNPASMFRNKIINGNFDVWQRGTAFNNTTTSTAKDLYTADRWVVSQDANTVMNLARIAFVDGQTEVPNNPLYYLEFNQSGTGNYCSAVQRIEDVHTLSGKTITLSFWIKGQNTGNIGIRIEQGFGTSGSSSVQVYSVLCPVTTTWTKKIITVNIPSVAGKTIGANSNLNIAFELKGTGSWRSAVGYTADFTQLNNVDIAQVQLEEGSIATPFEQRPIGIELPLCQRYFCKSFPLNVAPVNSVNENSYVGVYQYVNGLTNNDRVSVPFPVTMRTTPTITRYGCTGGYWQGQISTGNLGTMSSIVLDAINDRIFTVRQNYTSGTVNNAIGNWTADAEL